MSCRLNFCTDANTPNTDHNSGTQEGWMDYVLFRRTARRWSFKPKCLSHMCAGKWISSPRRQQELQASMGLRPSTTTGAACKIVKMLGYGLRGIAIHQKPHRPHTPGQDTTTRQHDKKTTRHKATRTSIAIPPIYILWSGSRIISRHHPPHPNQAQFHRSIHKPQAHEQNLSSSLARQCMAGLEGCKYIW